MARQKLALVFLFIGVMAVILSPWMEPSSPSVPTLPIIDGNAIDIVPLVQQQEQSQLKVEMALEESDFRVLVSQNKRFLDQHPDISVELLRIAPKHAYHTLKLAAQMGDSADIMLMPNEWVREFASSGYLQPADAVFVGTSIAEQLDAAISPLKWNGYLWGVPVTMDPLVLVWNMDLLKSWLGNEITLPLSLEQWRSLAARGSEALSPSWLALDTSDPMTLLSWLENAAEERSDVIWTWEGRDWEDTLFLQALRIVEQNRIGLAAHTTAEEAVTSLRNRQAAAALVPHSLAAALVAEPRLETDAELVLDYHSWQLPSIWPRGHSFVISSSTAFNEAAYLWIVEMTSVFNQQINLEERDLLPVSQSLYSQNSELVQMFPDRRGNFFPNQSSAVISPALPLQLEQLGHLWRNFTAGEITAEEWIREWEELIANSQLHD